MTPPPRSDLITFALVQLVTLVFTVLAGWFVFTQGTAELPSLDEWDLLTEYQLAGRQPVWYLLHHNEHRYPITKFLWLMLLQATNYNFHAPMFLTVGLLAATSLLLQWTARGRRGFSTAWDALYPALLLHWGHAFNLLMSYQFGFALVAYACAGWLWADRLYRSTGRVAWLIVAVLYLILLASTGGFGIAFTPAIVGWCVLLALQASRQRFRCRWCC